MRVFNFKECHNANQGKCATHTRNNQVEFHFKRRKIHVLIVNNRKNTFYLPNRNLKRARLNGTIENWFWTTYTSVENEVQRTLSLEMVFHGHVELIVLTKHI